MYYINCFFVYSVVGFLFETLVSKFTGNRFESGILFGPMTPIYGIGVVIILIISKYFFLNLHMPRWLETIIVLFVLMIVLTFIEWIGGILIEKIFGVVFWDYSHLKGSIGPYIALEITFVWGVLSLLLIYVIKPLLDGMVLKIPSLITYILLFLFLIDVVATYVNKKFF